MGSVFDEAGLGGPEEMTVMGQGVADDDMSDHSDDEDGTHELQGLAEEAGDPEGMDAWKMAQFARAMASPGASIIIKQDSGSSDEDDSDDEMLLADPCSELYLQP